MACQRNYRPTCWARARPRRHSRFGASWAIHARHHRVRADPVSLASRLRPPIALASVDLASSLSCNCAPTQGPPSSPISSPNTSMEGSPPRHSWRLPRGGARLLLWRQVAAAVARWGQIHYYSSIRPCEHARRRWKTRGRRTTEAEDADARWVWHGEEASGGDWGHTRPLTVWRRARRR
jgi:hypothetical protein